MTNFIPIFPLGIVVYPGEKLNLHIFEPRYKQLISECHEQKKAFGIPTVIGDKMQDHGCTVQIIELSKIHDNGEMDIKTEGMQVFRILEVIKKVPDKLYCGAIVNYPANRRLGNTAKMERLMEQIEKLHLLLKVKKEFRPQEEQVSTYDVAHHVGLSLQEEYELLSLFNERQRQEYLSLHLTKALPMLSGMEKLKEKILLNGHFKDLKGFDIS